MARKISLNFPEFLLFEGGSERNAMENNKEKKEELRKGAVLGFS